MTTVKLLPLTLLRENPWNPNVIDAATFASLVENVRRYGFEQPVLVRPTRDVYEIVDGAHRYRAAAACELTEIPCVVVEMTDAEAKAQTLAMNSLRGDMAAYDVAHLIRELEDVFTHTDLVSFTGFTLAEIDGLVDLPDFKLPGEPSGKKVRDPDAEKWVTLEFWVPESVALIVRQELSRLQQVSGFQHEHLCLEAMAVLSSQTDPEELR